MADWIITLSDDGMTRHTVAHEIAHAFQAHNGEGPEVEAEADRLASEWLSQK
jgi:Zn-dependent peptidase ImmA (M78 family)